MKTRKPFAALISLLIVLECLCTPAAIALNEESAPGTQPPFYNTAGSADAAGASDDVYVYRTTPDTVIFSVRETMNGNTGTSFTAGHYTRAYVGFGRAIVGEDGLETVASRTYSYRDRRFLPEGSDATYIGTDGANLSNSVQDYRTVPGTFTLPTGEQLGRTPDMEFDGWYIYGGNGEHTEANKTRDDTDKNVTYLDGTGTGSNYYELWSRMGSRAESGAASADISLDSLVAKGAASYDSATSVLYVNKDTAADLLGRLVRSFSYEEYEDDIEGTVIDRRLETYQSEKYLPIVGSWKKSSNATMTVATATGAHTIHGLYKYETANPSATIDKLTPIGGFGLDPDDETGNTPLYDYYIRVREDESSLTLSFAAYEPFLEFNNKYASMSTPANAGTSAEGYTTIYRSTYEPVSVTSAMTGVPVEITVNGKTLWEQGASLSYEVTNDGAYIEEYLEQEGGDKFLQKAYWTNGNSANAPAGSHWTLSNIPLLPASDDELSNSNGCNVIVITITPPNGEETDAKTYTFYVQRVSTPIATLEPGNTPAGIIEREDDTKWTGKFSSAENDSASYNKGVWLDFFESNLRVRNSIDNSSYYVRGSSTGYDITGDGSLYDGKFTDEAWGTEANLDFDSTAIVAYQNYAFADPGVNITMSSGAKYDGTVGKLERSIELRVPSGSGTMLDALRNIETSSTVYYDYDSITRTATLSDTQVWDTVTPDSLGVDLTDMPILPGIYAIQYKFTDPYTGASINFERPLVVLAIPGDVDMDGVTTVADAEALRYLINIGDLNYPDQMSATMKLFVWRVCNVGNTLSADIGTQSNDIETLANGWRPELLAERVPVSAIGNQSAQGVSDYFYPPLADPSGRYKRKEADGTVGSAVLGMGYEELTPATAESVAENAMFSAVLYDAAAYNTTTTEGIAIGDVFWVDVTVDSLGIERDITAFTYALSYDKRYVRPARLSDLATMTDGGYVSKFEGLSFTGADATIYDLFEDLGGAAWAEWATVVSKYNLQSGDDAVAVWKGNGYTLTTAAKPDGSYGSHFSKAITDLETEKGASNLGELVFAIKRATTNSAVNLNCEAGEKITLLRVPFIMESFPKDENGKALEGQLVDLISLNLGMHEFTIVTSGGDGAAGYAATVSASAYSAQGDYDDDGAAIDDGIFGDFTNNLMQKICFADTSLPIQIAEDNTPRTEIKNDLSKNEDDSLNYAKYGDEFSAYLPNYDLNTVTSMTITDGELPPGLVLDNSYIRGTPSAAGNFRFEIDNRRFEITVEKQPLRIYPIGLPDADKLAASKADGTYLSRYDGTYGKSYVYGESYYGESDYTDEGYLDMLDHAVLKDGVYPDSFRAEADTSFAYELRYGYEPADIKQVDIKAAADNGYTDAINDGSMVNLPYLISVRKDVTGSDSGNDLEFAHPIVESGRIAANSPVGKYEVSINTGEGMLPTLANYYYVVEDNPIEAWVEVLPRPFIVEKFNMDLAGEDKTRLSPYRMNDSHDPLLGSGFTARVGADPETGIAYEQFSTKAAQGADLAPDGRKLDMAKKLPISETGILTDDGDVYEDIIVSFSVTFQQIAEDLNSPGGKNFSIPENSSEPRPVVLSAISLTGGAAKDSYTLANASPTTGRIENGGIVSNVPVEAVKVITWEKVVTEITYGEELELSRLFSAYLDYSGIDNESPIEYTTPADFKKEMLYLSLVTKSQMDSDLEKFENDETVLFDDGSGGVVYRTMTEGVVLDANEEGYYLRVAYVQDEKDDLGESVIIKAAYSHAIVVHKRTVTLRTDNIFRYYGEHVEPSYSFAVQDLATPERSKITESFESENGEIRSTGVQLAKVLADSTDTGGNAVWAGEPTLRVVSSSHPPVNLDELQSAALVTKGTGYGADFYIGIYGATHKNYTFTYELIYSGMEGAIPTHAEYGYNYGRIYKRPIVLNALPGTLGDVYADIYNLTVTGWEYYADASSDTTFVLPDGASAWRASAGGKNVTEVDVSYDLSDTAIYGSDELKITCDFTLLEENIYWNTIANGYFDMASDNGAAMAILSAISLDTNYGQGNNYELVFNTESDAANYCPKTAEYRGRQISASDPEEYEYLTTHTNASFYVAGKVALHVRPITGISIRTDGTGSRPKTEYTYGEGFVPTGLTLDITFENKYGEQGKLNTTLTNLEDRLVITGETTATLVYSYNNLNHTSTFDRYKLSVQIDDRPVAFGAYLTPAEHDGASLTVHYGTSLTGGPLLESNGIELTVNKRKLKLYAVDQYRYYGEDNYSVRFVPGGDSAPGDAVYEYYFTLSNVTDLSAGLAAPDLEQLRNSGQFSSEIAGNTGFGYADKDDGFFARNSAIFEYLSSEETLKAMGRDAAKYSGYSAPEFHTEATAASDANQSYDLTLSGGFMDNYEFDFSESSAAITVYKRPIRVTGFYTGYTGVNGTDRSIYSIFTESTGQQTFDRMLYYKVDGNTYSAPAGTTFTDENGNAVTGSDLQPGYTGGAIEGWQWFKVNNKLNAAGRDNNHGITGLPTYARLYLTDGGIIGDDNPAFNVRVSFTGLDSVKKACIPATATVIGFAENADNYTFSQSVTDTLPARLEVRTIKSIHVVSLPEKPLANYVYGEDLSLKGLIIEIIYDKSENEQTPDPERVSYEEDLGSYGLYLNYYPFYDNESKITESPEEYKNIVTKYRPVGRGEHLTIAPVHDSASIASKPPTWKYGEFAHNGQSIIVSAQRPESEGGFVEPKLIRTEDEYTDANAEVQRIKVAPLELRYTLKAEDKDYDGTTRAVGSIELVNVQLDGDNVSDLVYIKTGEDYEDGDAWTWTYDNGNKSELQSHVIENGGYVFTSGSVAQGTLNDYMTYTDANTWNNGTLTFKFANANVRYVDDGYLDNTDANLKDDYWANDPAPKTSGDADWDEYATVGAMPVDVTNILLRGPDAANYTFTSGMTKHDINMTRMDDPNTPASQDHAPYATINRATRAAFDTAALGIPKIEIDDRTGVVRVLYNTANKDEVVTSIKEVSAADRKTRTGVESADFYDSELHIEYAIEYFLPGDDDSVDLADMTEYRGSNGKVWQDTYYFGGEAVSDLYGDVKDPTDDVFHASSFNFVSEEEEAEELSYDSELLGQLYKWTVYDSRLDPSLTVPYTFEGATSDVKLIQYLEMDEDDNLLPRDTTTWLLDDGFEFTVADTYASARVVEINGENYYYFYGYYTTDRDPIPRGAYVLGKVRMAQTHNYDVSEPLYSAAGYDGTDEDLLDELVGCADAATEKVNNYISDVAANDREDVEFPNDLPRTDVLKMYGYRIDLRSAEERDSADDTDETTYDYRLLRDVWFTDYTTYIEQEQLDAVVYNDIHSHYSGYYWDDLYQNALEFDEEAPIILGNPLELEVDRENREPQTQLETFNAGDTIPIYVETGSYSLIPERWINVLVDQLEFYDDDEPFDLSTLEVEFYPPRPNRLELRWTSSDESVVRITEDGMLEIVGPGTAIITATSLFDKTDTVTVIVTERPEPPVVPPSQTGIFNHELLAEFMGLDEDYFFYPEREMTRGELVMLAAMFFIANDSWTRQEAIEFCDIIGDEPYAEAVALLSEWGVIVGVGGDRFAGERVATRAEAAAILGRMLGVEPADYVGKPTFIDSTIDDTWATGYIAALRALGATNGIGNNLFAPNRNITRAEAAAMFTRLLYNQVPTPQVIVPADVSEDHWAFGNILRAVNNVILPAKLERDAENETEE